MTDDVKDLVEVLRDNAEWCKRNDGLGPYLTIGGCMALAADLIENLSADLERDERQYQPTIDTEPVPKWISVKDKLPETNNINDHTHDVLVYIPEREGCRQHGIYVGKLKFIKGSDGSDNFFGIKTENCEWLVWSWSYFEHPIITHWMPLPKPPKKENGGGNHGKEDQD